MRWKSLLMTTAVAVAALSVNGHWNRVHAEMAYGGGSGGCAVLGSPSNDFFCSEWTDEWGDPGSMGGGTGGSGGEPESRVCGRYLAQLCGGQYETTRVIERCIQYRITNISGGFTLVATKPASIEVGATLTCETRETITSREITMKRWDKY